MPPNSGYCDCCLERIQPRRGKYADLPFCSRCMSGECRDCRVLKRVDKHLRNLELQEQANRRVARFVGRPQGPWMPCGWQCGAKLTNHGVRAHFAKCPKRPTAAESYWTIRQQAETNAGGPSSKGMLTATAVENKPKPTRGRPSGPRMPCGWGCGASLRASDLRTHFVSCRKRPKG